MHLPLVSKLSSYGLIGIVLISAFAACDSMRNVAHVSAHPERHAEDETPAWEPFSGIDVQKYTVELPNLSETMKRVEQFTTVDVTLTATRTTLPFDLQGDGRVTVKSVKIDGVPATYETRKRATPTLTLAPSGVAGDYLLVNLPGKTSAGTTLRVRIQTTADIARNPEGDHIKGFSSFSDFGSGKLFETRSWPSYTRFWLPGNDHPSDAAKLEVVANVPASLTLLSNGALVEGQLLGTPESPAGARRTVRWRLDTPVPTSTFNIVMGRFDLIEFDTCGLDKSRFACAPGQALPKTQLFVPSGLEGGTIEGVKAKVQDAARALVLYSRMLGEYRFPKSAFVLMPHSFETEHASLITLNGSGNGVHEMVHHWWGNSVMIARWSDLWISEGITTYFTGYFDEVKRNSNSSCHGTAENDALELAPRDASEPMSLHSPNRACKGALAIAAYRDMLALHTGHAVITSAAARAGFEDVMRSVYTAHAGKATATEDILATMKANFLARARRTAGPEDKGLAEDAFTKYAETFFSR